MPMAIASFGFSKIGTRVLERGFDGGKKIKGRKQHNLPILG
jgi:hypothetical protein